jgi:glyoxylase I family protein
VLRIQQARRFWKIFGLNLGLAYSARQVNPKEAVMFKRIDHVEITSGDLERSIRFYKEVIGFTLKERIKPSSPEIEEIAFLTLGDTMLELLAIKNSAPAPKSPQVGFRTMAIEVDDMDQAIEYLKGKGVEVSWGPVTLGTSKRAEIRDPDGLSIELRQW